MVFGQLKKKYKEYKAGRMNARATYEKEAEQRHAWKMAKLKRHQEAQGVKTKMATQRYKADTARYKAQAVAQKAQPAYGGIDFGFGGGSEKPKKRKFQDNDLFGF